MTVSVAKEDHAAFLSWLQCYNNPNMNVIKDKSGRSVWFHVSIDVVWSLCLLENYTDMVGMSPLY